MLWRHLCLVRAWSAAGLISCAIVGTAAVRADEPAEPAPGPQAGAETVAVLEGQKAGDLSVQVHGQGQDRAKFTIKNNTARRLKVVLPPGLVAASVTGQIQSVGLGNPTNNPGSFGGFRSVAPAEGLKSVPARADDQGVVVPPGQTVDFSVPALCLNFGLPTPTLRDRFKLMDVDDYSADPRVRKALRSLATLGTSQGVAQAVMWRVCNNVPFEMMMAQFGKVVNTYEVELASRFIEALDASGSSDLVDAAYLTEGRIFVHVGGDAGLYRDAKRLNGQLDGLRILGLPVRAVGENEQPQASAPALAISVTLSAGKGGETRGRLSIRTARASSGWLPLGQANFALGSSASETEGAALAQAIDHAVASAFVSVRPAHRSVGSTTLKIENRLPLTLSTVVVKAGNSAGAPAVPLSGLGIGPARTGLAPIQAAGGTVDRVELNGL